jgi:hypothetical protein
MRVVVAPAVAALAALCFMSFVWKKPPSNKTFLETETAVVMPAAMQVVLYGGERFLAANIEVVRASMSSGMLRQDEAGFRIRAHSIAAQLNPCNEDNYWIGNAEMTWGGAQSYGLGLLRGAMQCRFWDQWPAFFYGFSQHFFYRNMDEARRGFELAAQRTDEAAAASFRNLAVMLLAGQYEDVELALKMVRQERDQSTDAKLKKMLDLRILRLEGLATLRQAQLRFEAEFDQKLTSANELVDSGFLIRIPEDPLKLGYEFRNGEFHLRQLRHEGLESLR